MDLVEVLRDVKYNLLNSRAFPYRTGQLKDNFFDENVASETNKVSVTALSNPLVFYGHILEVAPSIRYRITKSGNAKYSYKKRRNKHYLYIEKCINNSVIPFLENKYGVKQIWVQHK